MAQAPLSTACDLNPPSRFGETAEVTFVPMSAVCAESGALSGTQVRPAREVAKGYTRFQEGDVLFAKITPCMENGKAAIARELANGAGAGSTEFHVLRPREGALADWVWLFVRQEWFRRLAAENFSGTAGQRRVPGSFFDQVEIPLPPVEEQRRIVGVVKGLMGEVREARERLGSVPGLVKALKQSVLAKAFSGELTADWREANPDVEPASLLLERILTERQAKWEKAELAKMTAKGKTPKDDTWKAKYKEPTPPDTTDLDELPEGWCWASLDALASRITSGSRDWSKYYSRDAPETFVMAQNIRPLEYDFSFRQPVAPPPETAERDRTAVEQGDILITIVGANTGDTCVFPRSGSGYFVCQSVALVRPLASSAFLSLALCCPIFVWEKWTDWIYGEGRPHLSFDHLRSTPIALAPLAEQEEIVRRVEAAFAEADALASAATDALTGLKRLEQSILQSAFSGGL